METCPICRARLNGATVCRRCRAELGTVQALERRGQALTVTALQALARGDSAGAAHWLGRARWVHATPMVRVLEWVVDALETVQNPGVLTPPGETVGEPTAQRGHGRR